MADGAITPEEQAQIDKAAAKTAAAVKALTAADVNGRPTACSTRRRRTGWTCAATIRPAAARNLKMPLLILQGERDYQVTMDDFARWKSALAETAIGDVPVVSGAEPLVHAGTGKSLPAEYPMPSHVAEEVIRDIAAWIKR